MAEILKQPPETMKTAIFEKFQNRVNVTKTGLMSPIGIKFKRLIKCYRFSDRHDNFHLIETSSES